MSDKNSSMQYINPDKAKVLLEKWKAVLDYDCGSVLPPIEDNYTRLCTAMVLENQDKYCVQQGMRSINEANIAGGTGNAFGYNGGGATFGNGGGSVGNSDSYAAGDARLPKILIPMIRRTFPELITNEICGVQPMSGPVGMAFAMRYFYDGNSLDYQDPTRRTYDATNPTAYRGGVQADANGKEVGYQYLNTGYTGTSSSSLSGMSSIYGEFEFMDEDMGVAEILSNYEFTGQIPQLTMKFEKTTVEAGTRRLAAKWSTELEQDLKNMNGIDIDTEVTQVMSYEIQAEIDREMMMRMVQICLNAGYGPGYSVWSPETADGRWRAERTVDFYQRGILLQANQIAVRNRRGPANFIIATPTVCAMLESLPDFKFNPIDSTVKTQTVGVSKVGQLAGRFQVYRDTRTEGQQPYMNGTRTNVLNYCLLGYKGAEFFDTSIVYCPYIPVMVQRTIGQNDMSPRVGLMTRYGVVDHLFGAHLYLHLIILQGLGTAMDESEDRIYM